MPEVENITVKVNYEIYEGLPTVAKWVEVINNSDEAKVINKIESEILALSQDQFRRIYAQSDYSFAMVGGAHTEADIVDMWTNEHVPFSGSPVRLMIRIITPGPECAMTKRSCLVEKQHETCLSAVFRWGPM